MFKKTIALLCLACSVPLFAQVSKEDDRISQAAGVLKSIAGRQEVPKNLLERAECVIVYPSVKKVGVGIGVSYGRGVISCRTGNNYSGPWSPPAMYKLDTGSLGVQLGSTATDYVLLVMTSKGAEKVLSGKLKLGADATAVAGDSGAKAVGANDPNVDLITYSQAKGGLFAGASLGSASLSSDDDANKVVYGKDVSATQIVRDGAVTVTPAGKGWMAALNTLSPNHLGN
jgi:lipid-binding SYLF domain-containing protein